MHVVVYMYLIFVMTRQNIFNDGNKSLQSCIWPRFNEPSVYQGIKRWHASMLDTRWRHCSSCFVSKRNYIVLWNNSNVLMLFYWRPDVTSLSKFHWPFSPSTTNISRTDRNKIKNVCTILKRIVHSIKKYQNTKIHILVHFVGFVTHWLK